MKIPAALLALAVFTTLNPAPVNAQVTVIIPEPGGAVYIAPHMRPIKCLPPRPLPPRPVPPPVDTRPVEVTQMDALVRIEGLRATTTLTVTMENPGSRPQESIALLPVPAGAAITALALDGTQGKFTAQLLPKDEARKIYDEIVRQVKDPALLEFAGAGLVKSSVFPIPANGKAVVSLTYEEILPAESGPNGRIDYVLPRTESPENRIPWTIDVTWKNPGGHASLYSPSHPLTVTNESEDTARVRISGQLEPGPFRLSSLPVEAKGLGANVAAYPVQGSEDGAFMLFVSPPSDKDVTKLKRELTLVFDRSGSMAGEKMDQARAAALQVIEGLEDGEAFNIVLYNESVESLFDSPRVKDAETTKAARQYIDGIRVSGGTNIHGALQKTLAQPATPGMLPVVLFLTDGIPTIGETLEKTIRDAAKTANKAERRIFTFGVGADVNTPLLSRIADDSRAVPTFVLPKENVEVKVTGVFQKLAGPVIASPELRVLNPDGTPAPGRVSDIVPVRIPDLFVRDLQIILGRYHGDQPLKLELSGKNAGNETLVTQVTLDPKSASLENSHIPRLWATRRIAILSEALRDLGSTSGVRIDPSDSRTKELIDEIVRLSLRHGIMTEYTAFLARETTPLAAAPSTYREEAAKNYQSRGVEKRSGLDSVNQDLNIAGGKSASSLNRYNRQWDSEMAPAALSEGQIAQIADKSFYRREGAWVDAEAAAKTPAEQANAVTITPDDADFPALVDRLVAANRQSVLALDGDILMEDNHTLYRIVRAK